MPARNAWWLGTEFLLLALFGITLLERRLDPAFLDNLKRLMLVNVINVPEGGGLAAIQFGDRRSGPTRDRRGGSGFAFGHVLLMMAMCLPGVPECNTGSRFR